MTLLVQPRLVNDPFSDAALYLDFRFRRRALLFDLGDVSRLFPREILRTSHVFVSHLHMDHFFGFDRLLRLFLNRDAKLVLTGPPGLADAVEAKLRAYSWNLLDASSPDFRLVARDWSATGFAASGLFRARSAFRREDGRSPEITGVLLEDPEFQVEAATLDHGVSSLAFAFQEGLRVNVLKPRLDDLGLPVGPWLTEAKRAVRQSADADTIFTPVPGRSVALGELLGAGALRTGPGQRIVYATDLAWTPDNVASLVALARGADHLFIEAAFLAEDREAAVARKHLTAAQAGAVARMAGVGFAVPTHFSSRYVGRESELRREFAEGWRGAIAVSVPG